MGDFVQTPVVLASADRPARVSLKKASFKWSSRDQGLALTNIDLEINRYSFDDVEVLP